MRLTIGMPSYKNFTEIWFTIQSLRMNHNLTDCEILVVDNFGDPELEKFINNWGSKVVRYEKYTDVVGTSEVRNKVFDLARGEMVLCMDSHVLLKPGSLDNIPITDDLIHGPLIYDDCKNYTCEWLPVWRGQMWGIWGNCLTSLPEKPFEIWGAGLGIFLTKRSSWLRFNSKFRGFGGEEGYIHEKYRKAGRKVWCYPKLVWMHLFQKPIPYPLKLIDRVRNYLIGFEELGLDVKPIIDHFGNQISTEAQQLIGTIKPITPITPIILPKPKSIEQNFILTSKPKAKLSCVMITYRRFTCVERSISMFLNQDYKDLSELIIFNTDIDHPLELGNSLKNKNIHIFNCKIDSITGQSYVNIGAIRRDALLKASGDYYICWDDDDIFLPWNNRQGIDGVERNKLKAFKPEYSLFTNKQRIEIAKNVMEASVTVELKEVFFNLTTGSEHLSWYTKLRDLKQLKEDSKDSVPSYAFNWGDPSEIAGHKQSGAIDNPNNFENHKNETKDFAKRPLEKIDLTNIYKPYYEFFKNHIENFNKEYYDRYIASYIKSASIVLNKEKMISALCITYGKPHLLEEALESFLRQTYKNKELIILNDLAEQTLIFNHPQVKIYNFKERFKSLGEKRNKCIELSKGDVLVGWDDDDISLPWRLQQIMDAFNSNEELKYFKPDKAWCYYVNDLMPPHYNIFYMMAAFTRKTFYDIGQYKNINAGEDSDLCERMIAKYGENAKTIILKDEEYPFIYGWRSDSFHISSFGKEDQNGINLKKAENYIKQRPIESVVLLKPQWKQDYLELTRNALMNLKKENNHG